MYWVARVEGEWDSWHHDRVHAIPYNHVWVKASGEGGLVRGDA
jgi:hypothetical protein